MIPSLEIPAVAELATWRRWVLHRAKQPITTTGGAASTTKPATWCAFEKAASAYVAGMGDGMGFVFTETPFAGIDLDKVIRPDGALEPWAQRIIETFDSYTETSPSGRGLHVIVRGALPGRGRKRGPLEVYDSGRFFTMTGRPWPGAPEEIQDRSTEIRDFYMRTFGEAAASAETPEPSTWDGTLPESVGHLATTNATVRLTLRKRSRALGYTSASEADWALACTLAEARVPAEEIEAALRWRHAHTEPRPKSLDYFPRTAANALANVGTRAAR